MSLDLAKAQRTLTDKLIDLPGVAGVGVGSHGGKPCLKVFLEGTGSRLAGRIPSSVLGIPVKVEKSGPFRGGG